MICSGCARYFAIALLLLGGCNRFRAPSSEAVAQLQEQKRLQDQQERAALAERLRAAAIEREKKREPIRVLQAQIDALDRQIDAAWQSGKDWRPLEKVQEKLEEQKAELEKDL